MDTKIDILCNAEARLDTVKYDILCHENDESMIWVSDPQEGSNYLKAIIEIQQVINYLEEFKWSSSDWQANELLCDAHSILQMGMARLEDEFAHMFEQNKQYMEQDDMSLQSSEGDRLLDFSSNSCGEDSIQEMTRPETSSYQPEEESMILPPNVLNDMKCIVEVMLASGYDKECCRAYVTARKNSLEECFSYLQIERLSIQELMGSEWNCLHSKVRKWNQATRIFVQVHLVGEKSLLDAIFGEYPQVDVEACLVEISSISMLQLLNFAEGVAIGCRSPQRMFKVIEMYENLTELLPEVKSLFPQESGSFVWNEWLEVMQRLVEYVKGTLSEFQIKIHNHVSSKALTGGGLHPSTRYVMNYIGLLSEYEKTVSSMLEWCPGEGEGEGEISPLTKNVLLITSALESNLESKSLLYQDASMQHLFMLNNIYYMVNKVSGNLLNILGKDWLRDHIQKYRQHARNCERSSWNPVITFLKKDGICGSGSCPPSVTILKKRFRSFNTAFEDVYRIQTGWTIPDDKLREDMKISISSNVLQAYRSFTGLYQHHLDSIGQQWRYIKYSSEDLQNLLLDLFEGNSKSLH